MQSDFIQSTEEGAAEWCVVYDVRTGKVVHIHQVVFAEAREPRSSEELEQEALEMAAGRHPRENLRVAHPSGDIQLAPDLDYRVDTQSGRLRAQSVDLLERRKGKKGEARGEPQGG